MNYENSFGVTGWIEKCEKSVDKRNCMAGTE